MALYPAPDMTSGAVSVWVSGDEQARTAVSLIEKLGHSVSVLDGTRRVSTRFDPAGPLRGALRPPSDKSISHRAALIAAMAEGESSVEGFLDAADTRSTLAAVEALGARVDGAEGVAPEIRIAGVGLQGANSAAIDVGNAGTLLRLLPGWLAGQPGGTWELDGDDSIRRRPVDRIVEPLRRMGAGLSCREDRLPPLGIEGAPLTGISYELPVASAQVKSCLLFAGLLAEGETRVVEPLPSRDHSERMLSAAGADVRRQDGAVAIAAPERLEAGRIVVPADFSSAAFFLVGALLVPGQRRRPDRGRAQPDPHRAARRARADGRELEIAVEGEPAASRPGPFAPAPGCGAPKWAAPRCRWRSTSCRWWRSRPASPRGRRRSPTQPSCAARSRTGSQPSRRR